MKTRRTDRGSVLVLTLVVTVVLALVVVATATYVSADLRYASVVEDRADALATSEGGATYAIEQLRRGYPCVGAFDRLPVSTNGADLSVSCSPVGASFAGLDDWAAVITGEGVPLADDHLRIAEGGNKTIGGRMFMTDPGEMNISGGSATPGLGGLAIEDGDLFYGDDCSTEYRVNDGSPPNLAEELDERFFMSPDPATIVPGQLICLDNSTWMDVALEPPIDLPTNTVVQTEVDPMTPTYYEDYFGCRVFEPGIYNSALAWSSSNYFPSGNYFFNNVDLTIPAGSDVTVGYPANVNFVEVLSDDSGDPICQEARIRDAGTSGATWYLGGSSRIRLRNQTRLEMLPLAHTDAAGDDKYVSLHVLSSGPNASTLGGANEIITVAPGATAEAVFQGRVWAPYQRVSFQNVAGGANGQLTGGVVAASLYGNSNPSTSGFKIQADTSPADYRLLVASTATKNGASVTVHAVVEQRLNEPDPDDRIAVNSLRVID